MSDSSSSEDNSKIKKKGRVNNNVKVVVVSRDCPVSFVGWISADKRKALPPTYTADLRQFLAMTEIESKGHESLITRGLREQVWEWYMNLRNSNSSKLHSLKRKTLRMACSIYSSSQMTPAWYCLARHQK